MFIGIDLGTSEVKALLLDAQQHIVATAGAPLEVQQPHALWREQDPAAWWQATGLALDRLADSHPAAMAAVEGIGLSGQMHGAVLLGEDDRVLRPAILWSDGRSFAECAALEAAWPGLVDVAGNRAMPGFTAPKLAWVRRHEPGVFAQVRRVLLPKDWLRLRLSGEAVSDLSDAAGTLWLDVARRDWSDEALALTGLTRAHMPRLVEGSAVGGQLRADLAARWGLRAGIPIAGGGGDNAASAVGIGAVQPGQGFVSLGTSGVVFLSGAGFRPNPARGVHAFCHALPGRWHQMSVMLAAASALRWVRVLLRYDSEAALLEDVGRLSPADKARAPLFLPYLNGERTPHNDPALQGVLFGLGAGDDAARIGYAVLEGVSFGLRDGWDALGAAPGEVQALSLVGGGARSGLWAQQLASLFGVPLQTHEGGEAGGALGAARLAWLAARGVAPGSADEAAVCAAPPVKRVFVPDAEEAAVLAPRLDRFRALFGAVQGQFPQA